jgi:hypothetical protein
MPQRTRLDLLLDGVVRYKSELRIDADGYTPSQVDRIVSTAEERNLHAAFDGRFVLIRAM